MITTASAARRAVAATIPTVTALRGVKRDGELIGFTFDYGSGRHFGWVTIGGAIGTEPWGWRPNAKWGLDRAHDAAGLAPVNADGMPQCSYLSASHHGLNGWSGCEAGGRLHLVEDWRASIRRESERADKIAASRSQDAARRAGNLRRCVAESERQVAAAIEQLAAEAVACTCETVWNRAGQRTPPPEQLR